MRHLLIPFAIVLLSAVSVAEAQIGITANGTTRKYATPPGGPGSSYQKAIIIQSADWTSGLTNEYNYVQSHFPGCKIVNHSREYYTGRTYDIISFTARDGSRGAMYFNYRKHS